MSTLAELVQRMTSLGRPSMLEAIRRQKPSLVADWDKQNPALAAEYWRLHGERETLLAEADKAFSRSAEERTQARQLELATQGLNSAGVPDKAFATSEAPRETDAVRMVREWWKGGRPFALVAGGVGTGKSVAAAVACRLATADGKVPLFVRALDAARRGLYGDDAAEVRRWKRAGLWVLDDLGAEQSSGPWLMNFLDVIDARHEAGARTLLTTNLDEAAVAARYEPRVIRRLRESALQISTGSKPRGVK